MAAPDPKGRIGVRPRKVPLTKGELLQHLINLKLSQVGIDYVMGAEKTGPSKSVREGGTSNLRGDRHSTTPTAATQDDVNWRVQFQSLHPEFGFSVMVDADGDALMVLDQPPGIEFQKLNKAGRRQRIRYTPDYLLVMRDRVRVVELKREKELIDLCNRDPANWVRVEGEYQYLPAAQAYRELGIQFDVVAAESIPWLSVQNTLLLWKERRHCVGSGADTAKAQIAKFVKTHEPCSFRQIIDGVELPSGELILEAIKDRLVFVDIDNANLASPDSRFIHSTQEEADLTGTGLASIQKTARTDLSVSLDDTCDPRHLAEFGYRLAMVKGRPATRPKGKKDASASTIRKWKKKFQEGGEKALWPQWFKSGKQRRDTAEWHYRILIEQIKKDRSLPERPSITGSYGNYTAELEEKAKERQEQTDPVSYSWYCQLWNARKHSTEDAFERGGKREANAVAPHGDVDEQMPLTVRPFQLAHTDYCQVPTLARSDDTGEEGKPWIGVLFDDYKGPESDAEPLAVVMFYGAPSFRGDGLLARECVRRHGRLPESIYSDNGSNFDSTMYQELAANYGMDAFVRPAANPRKSSNAERPLLTYANAVCRGKVGFQPDMKIGRAVSPSKRPGVGRRRQYEDLLENTRKHFYEDIANRQGSDGEQSPREVREEFEGIYGRQGIAIERDLRFQIVTAYPLKMRGKTEQSGAIRHGTVRYYCTDLIGKALHLKKLQPKQDPEDPSIIYVCLRDRWVVAKARIAIKNRGLTDDAIAVDAEAKRRPRKTDKSRGKAKRGMSESPYGIAAADGPERKEQGAETQFPEVEEGTKGWDEGPRIGSADELRGDRVTQ